MKRGRFSLEEQDKIRKMVESNLTVGEIARSLDREIASVDNWIESNLGYTEKDREDIELANELRNTPYYKQLKKQFTDDQIELFEIHWKNLWKQFKNDVFHTEIIQILDLCKIEVMMNDILIKNSEDSERLVGLKTMLMEEQNKDQENRDVEVMMNLNRQIDSIDAATNNRNREFKDLLKEKNTMLKNVKGTRDQRIKDIESDKNTWTGLLKKISTDPDFRDQMSKSMEKLRIATEKKKQELVQPFEYKEGHIDSPILRPEDFDE